MQLGKKGTGAKGEDAAVPRVFARGDELLGAALIGFLDKLGDLEAAAAGNRLAPAQIAEAGFGGLGLDAEGYQPVFSSERCGGACSFGELVARIWGSAKAERCI